MDTHTDTDVTNNLVVPAFSDDRGDIYDLVEDTVSHIGLITFKAGVERGKHYHLKSVQYSYILDGEIELTTSTVDGTNKVTTLLKKGMVTKIPVGVVHTYKAVTDASILDMTTMSRLEDGYEQDTVRVVL